MWHTGSKEGEETLTVTVDNSFNGAVSKSGEKFLSSKRNEVGTGLASVYVRV
ncbi:MAG: hypothetical protein RR475_12575 [Clostridia bacterium]